MSAELNADGFPAYAHIPGSNARHREDLFSHICASVTEDMALSDLGKTDAWRIGLSLFRNEFYWEAHEVLEAVWVQCPPNSVERQFVQAIIQIANARLKLLMDRPKAAIRLFDLASEHFREAVLQSNKQILNMPTEFVEAELQALQKSIVTPAAPKTQ